MLCNGDESCDEGQDESVHSGDSCTSPEICNESNDECLLLDDYTADDDVIDGDQVDEDATDDDIIDDDPSTGSGQADDDGCGCF